jgi:hypothetical protein
MTAPPEYRDPPLHSSAGLRTDFLDSEVVPEADNPLRGWRWFGAEMLYSELWPKRVLSNPVMVYYSGRRGSSVGEDWLGLLPWAMLLLVHVVYCFVLVNKASSILGLAAVELVLLPIMAAVVSAVMTGSHVRSVMQGMALEEFLVTPLTPLDLVQGFSVRPIAVQAAAHFGFLVANAILVLLAVWHHEGTPGFEAFLIMAVWSPVVWYLMRGTNELGGAYGLRAHLCIKDAQLASMRAMLEVGLYVVIGVGAGLVLLLGMVVLIHLTFGMFCLLVPAILLLVPWVIVRQTRNWAVAAMDFCHENPQEWWTNELNEEERFVRRRELLTPWDAVDVD